MYLKAYRKGSQRLHLAVRKVQVVVAAQENRLGEVELLPAIDDPTKKKRKLVFFFFFFIFFYFFFSLSFAHTRTHHDVRESREMITSSAESFDSWKHDCSVFSE